MRDTRWTVLESIKTEGRATVASLATALGVSHITIRHHLATLEADGLIGVQTEREGVGRPKYVYTVTEAAQRYFPNRYHELVEGLLHEIKSTLPPGQVDAILDGMAARVAARHNTERIDGTLEHRLERLVEILGEEGFMAEVRHVNGSLVLTELNCPYLYVGQHHPEVCRIDRALIQGVLGRDVQQTSCILHGNSSCTFSVDDKDSTT